MSVIAPLGERNPSSTDIYRKHLRFKAQNDPESGARWELLVAPHHKHMTLWLFNERSPEGREVALSSYTPVVAFFMMYAVCRGFDLHQIQEGTHDVVIDCGVVPPI